MSPTGRESAAVVGKRKRNSDNSIEKKVSLDDIVSPNFEELARQYPIFRQAWNDVKQRHKSKGGTFASHITQEFSISLSKALLHVHWNLALTHISEHHLCPPIPNRFFYVQWIQNDLLPMFLSRRYFAAHSELSRCGLDIGTGAFCIYPLLFAASTNTPYTLFGTDIDEESIDCAMKNVQSNKLESMIHIIQVPLSDAQLAAEMNEDPSIATMASFQTGPLLKSLDCIPNTNILLDFSMTNPPFYDDSQSAERIDPRAGDGRDRTAMTASEGSYPGGEVAFVLDVLADALYLFNNNSNNNNSGRIPKWMTCMCGKKASFVMIKSIVTRLLGQAHVCATEFGPGQLTRWFLAWTLERPQMTSPLADIKQWNFDIPIASSTPTLLTPIKEVSNRVIECFNDIFSSWNLTTKIKKDMEHHCEMEVLETYPSDNWNDSKPFPGKIQSLVDSLDRALFLPTEGHFLLQISVLFKNTTTLSVSIQSYAHTERGKEFVNKTRLHLQSEVCRTSRRWRRRLTRQQQEQVESMDIS